MVIYSFEGTLNVYQQQHTREKGRQLGRCGPQYASHSATIEQAGGGHMSTPGGSLWQEF